MAPATAEVRELAETLIISMLSLLSTYKFQVFADAMSVVSIFHRQAANLYKFILCRSPRAINRLVLLSSRHLYSNPRMPGRHWIEEWHEVLRGRSGEPARPGRRIGNDLQRIVIPAMKL